MTPLQLKEERLDKIWIALLVGATSVIGAYHFYLNSKEKRCLDDKIDLIKHKEFLESNHIPHRPLISVLNELLLMLTESIAKEGQKYRFKPKYPLSFNLLIGSSYEQSIKLYIKTNNISVPGGKPTLESLEDRLSEHLSICNPDSEIKRHLDQIMKLDIRNMRNHSAHHPHESESLAPMLEKNDALFRFINYVMTDAVHSAVATNLQATNVPQRC